MARVSRADERAMIFERFRQRGEHPAHTEGFGLGLYISKLLTEAMGGWLDVASSRGDGLDVHGHAPLRLATLANTRSTVRSSAVGLKGFVKYSSAPAAAPLRRPSSPVGGHDDHAHVAGRTGRP